VPLDVQNAQYRETRQYLTGRLTDAYPDPASVVDVQDARTTRVSMAYGPGGGLKCETVWEANKLIAENFFGGRGHKKDHSVNRCGSSDSFVTVLGGANLDVMDGVVRCRHDDNDCNPVRRCDF
jgi:hypothetical protein